MSSFCETETIPADKLEEIYSETTKAILPTTLPTLTNGLADDSWLSGYVESLTSSGKLPVPPRANEINNSTLNSSNAQQPLSEFVTKENELIRSIKTEYCFYEKRYLSALDYFLQNVSSSSLQSTASPATVETKLNTVRLLNKKLTVLTQIVNAIAKYRYQSSTQYQTEINSLNTTFQERQGKLVEQSNILERETAAADLHKRMVEYTIEKNKANQNLLSLFAILNITALGMLFYVSR